MHGNSIMEKAKKKKKKLRGPGGEKQGRDYEYCLMKI